MDAVVTRICKPHTVWLLDNRCLENMAEHYGAATKAYLPRLKAFRSKVISMNKPNRAATAKAGLDAGIAAIEKTTARKKLISIKDL